MPSIAVEDGALLGIKLGASIAGPVGAFVGAFVGYLLGGAIGSLFGGTPKSGVAVGWNAQTQQFDVGNAWSKSGGSKASVEAMANQVSMMLNTVLKATGASVVSPDQVRVGAYETKGADFIYKVSAGGGYAYRSKDFERVVTQGQFLALADLASRLRGGDVFAKRAVQSTLLQAGGDANLAHGYAAGDFDAQTLIGNLSVAQDYEDYLSSKPIINAVLEAEPESAFAATWIATLSHVGDLGLNRRWASDWSGGWSAFLDESVDGRIDGQAQQAANTFLELAPVTGARLFELVDARGAVLGVLGDTIDETSKTRVIGVDRCGFYHAQS